MKFAGPIISLFLLGTFGCSKSSTPVTTSTAPTYTVTLSTLALSFAAIAGTPASTQTVTLGNTGTASLTLGTPAITGTNASNFTLSSTCGATLAPGANCIATVGFVPASVQSFSATLAFTDNASNSPQNVALSGTGTASTSITISPNSLTFTSAALSSSAPQSVTLMNTGVNTLTVTSIALAGANPTLFTQTTNCGASLAPNTSCTVSVYFSPTAKGTFAATLVFTDSAPASPQTVTLNGTGN